MSVARSKMSKGTGSIGSNDSSITNLRVRAKARRARLQVELEMEPERRNLEEEEFQIIHRKGRMEQEKRIMDIKMAIAKADAEDKVYAEYDDEVIDHVEQQGEAICTVFSREEQDTRIENWVDDQVECVKTKGHEVTESVKRELEDSHDDPVTPKMEPPSREVPDESVPRRQISPRDHKDELEALKIRFSTPCNRSVTTSEPNTCATNHEVMYDVVKELRKPVSEIEKFDDNPLKFKKFMRQFQTRVLNNASTADERINFLEQFTTGKANDIVSGFSVLDAEIAYESAIKELNMRFGDSEVIANSYVKVALDWPQIKGDSPKGLDAFSIFLIECENAVKSISSMGILEYPDNLRRLVQKLPFYLHDRWRGKVSDLKEKEAKVTFSHLVEFVRKEAKKQNDPVYGKAALFPEASGKQTVTKVKSFAVPEVRQKRTVQKSPSAATRVSESSKDPESNGCEYCKHPTHSMDSCQKFKDIDVAKRFEFVIQESICFGCLKNGHRIMHCEEKKKCQKCSRYHHPLLHADYQSPTRLATTVKDTKSEGNLSSEAPVVTAQCSMEVGSGMCTMAIIPVRIRRCNSTHSICTYAFLDRGSTVSFMTDGLVKELGATGRKTKISLDTMSGSNNVTDSQVLKGLELLSLDGMNVIKLSKLYSKQSIPVTNAHIPTNQDIARWSHLSSIQLPDVNAEIGLLIGNNEPDVYSPLEVVTGPCGSPHATRTLLGWTIWNLVRPTSQPSSTSMAVNRCEVTEIEEYDSLEKLHELLRSSINLEFPELKINDRREHSQEDKRFIQHVDKSIQFQNGHYEIGLPFRDVNLKMPSNRDQVKQRLKGIKNRMQKDSKFKEHYESFMTGIIMKGFAEVVPKEELNRNDGRVWYIPHFGVYHSKKPDKLRVVFDCAAKYHGVSLNDNLLQGPDLTNSLVGVLLRFRQENVAIMADIETMFYQVNVPESDKDLLRFYWFKDGDLQKEPVEYRMTVHLFGGNSSPSCSNSALHQTAKDNRAKVSPDILKVIDNNFYVDDLLDSVEDEDSAIRVIKETKALCSSGGFNLTKWMSNSRRVLETIPEDDRAKDVRDFDFQNSLLPRETALGVLWNTEDDSFGFKINVALKPMTRRGILSIVSSVYDPLGFAAPVILSAKILLQMMCHENTGWDEEVGLVILVRWTKWLSDLPLLEEIRLKRCLKSPNLGAIKSCQLHHFSDGSEQGYGVVTYIRFEDVNFRIHCAFVLAKARVAPLKKTTIPRLELTAATAGVRINKMVLKELEYDVNEEFFWTDSTIVLSYIFNEAKRFLTFVANRVTTIREGSELSQWRFIKGDENPADDPSRGLPVDKFLTKEEWFKGPNFLWKERSHWPKQPTITQVSDDDPEVKKSVAAIVLPMDSFLDELIERFSSWNRLRTTVAWLLVLKGALRNAVKLGRKRNLRSSVKTKKTHLTLSEIQDAELLIIKFIQRKYFSEEIDKLSNPEPKGVGSSSSIKRLNPILKDGILRVGGRLERSSLSMDSAHQIILPRDSRVSHLILLDIHKSLGHTSRNMVLAKFRERFWVPSAISLIKHLVSKCVICRRYRGKVLEQQMAPLPSDRLVPEEPPFTRTGVDFFGPVFVRRGRSTVKRYGVIFTCLVVRAVHLEVAYSLDTDSCINALFRFQARRGQNKLLWSDNGTNFVGANAELQREIEAWNQSKITAAMRQRGVEWKFNPPSGSHHGGVWERQIRSVRKVMYGVLKEQQLHMDDEGLHTMFCEVEAIINGRPLTVISDDPTDLKPLTPNHLLLLQPPKTLPPGVFNQKDNFVRRRWRQVQYLANLFWKRWLKEYLPAMQERQRWLNPKRNLTVGDIVLVVDNNTHRNTWLMGKVTEVMKDRNKLVRIAHVKTKHTVLVRPVSKLCLLLEADL